MAIYNIEKTLKYIKEKPFKLEKEIQDLTENNLKTIFGLEFVKSEFALNNFRIDTLAFDKEANAFVIIEYKRDKNFSVIDQGYAYLALMLNNKADFILEFNENLDKTLKRNDVDWSQSRVLFVSPAFTNYQIEAINFKDLPIELWEVKRFENNTVSYDEIKKSGAQESVKTITKKNKTTDNVVDELKVYTEQEHINSSEFEIRELYEQIKDRLLNFGDVTLNPRKHFIGFKIEGNTFCDIVFLNKGLKIYMNLKSGELDDSKGISRDVSNVGHWGNGAYEIKIRNSDEIDYIMSLLKQSFNNNLK